MTRVQFEFVPLEDNLEAGPEAGVIEHPPMGFPPTDVCTTSASPPSCTPNPGTETFTFAGDGDIWGFVNGHLAVDLGRLHAPALKVVDLAASTDSLGLTAGSTYNLDLFHAGPNYESNFRIDTQLSFAERTRPSSKWVGRTR